MSFGHDFRHGASETRIAYTGGMKQSSEQGRRLLCAAGSESFHPSATNPAFAPAPQRRARHSAQPHTRAVRRSCLAVRVRTDPARSPGRAQRTGRGTRRGTGSRFSHRPSCLSSFSSRPRRGAAGSVALAERAPRQPRALSRRVHPPRELGGWADHRERRPGGGRAIVRGLVGKSTPTTKPHGDGCGLCSDSL